MEPWFASLICSRNVVVIQSIRISKSDFRYKKYIMENRIIRSTIICSYKNDMKYKILSKNKQINLHYTYYEYACRLPRARIARHCSLIIVRLVEHS